MLDLKIQILNITICIITIGASVTIVSIKDLRRITVLMLELIVILGAIIQMHGAFVAISSTVEMAVPMYRRFIEWLEFPPEMNHLVLPFMVAGFVATVGISTVVILQDAGWKSRHPSIFRLLQLIVVFVTVMIWHGLMTLN